jgi:hypothetical protein
MTRPMTPMASTVDSRRVADLLAGSRLGLVADPIAQEARNGDLREDVAPAELAAYCLHTLTAAGSLPSQAAVRRLVSVSLDGLRLGVAGARKLISARDRVVSYCRVHIGREALPGQSRCPPAAAA